MKASSGNVGSTHASRNRRSHRRGTAAIVAGTFCLAIVAAACVPPTTPAEPNFQITTVISGLNLPTSVRFADDGRVFVAERAGRLLEYDSVTDRSGTVVANLSNEVTTMWDRGFMGIELDPEFTTGRPYIYALYSYNAPLGQTAPVWTDGCVFAGFGNNGVCGVSSGRLLRIEVGPDNKAVSQTPILTDWCQQFGGHSVDDLKFDSDGALYVSAGEGANFETVDWGQLAGNPCGDPVQEGGMLRAQDARTTSDPTGLDGSVIRIDPDTGAAWPTNPWANDPDPNRARIIAHGFRNPFRLSVDPVSRDLFIAEVGWGHWEEVNQLDIDSDTVPNFGWPCYEGPDRQPLVEAANLPLCQTLNDVDVTAPVYEYSHGDSLGAGCGTGGTSVTGLATVRNNPYPAPFNNGLYMADYSRQCIWFVPRTSAGNLDFGARRSFVTGAGAVDLQIGTDGLLYYVDTVAGSIVRIASTGTNHAPVASLVADPTSGQSPLTVSLDAAGSTDEDGDVLTTTWDLDGDGEFDDATGTTASVTFTDDGNHTVAVRVKDPNGATDEASTSISVGNEGPTASIDLPLPGIYVPGTDVSFSGSAVDPEDGDIPASSLAWVFTIEHCDGPGSCHRHQIGTVSGVASGTFEMPEHPRPSFVEIALTATDSEGATHTALRSIEVGDHP